VGLQSSLPPPPRPLGIENLTQHDGGEGRSHDVEWMERLVAVGLMRGSLAAR